MDEPLRVLILGQSNSRGVQLPDAGDSWPEVFARGLPLVVGGPAEVTTRPFFAYGPGAIPYLERELEKWQPHVVFLMVTTFPFLNRVVEPAIRRRLGSRAGDLYRSAAERLDRSTRFRGGFAAGLNRRVRWAAVRVLGGKPVSSYEATLQGTTDALRALARVEDIETVAFHGFVRLERRRGGEPTREAELVDRFLSEVNDAAAALRVPFINMQPRDGRLPPEWFYPDGVHVTPEAHEAVAACALEAFRTGVLRVSTPTPAGDDSRRD